MDTVSFEESPYVKFLFYFLLCCCGVELYDISPKRNQLGPLGRAIEFVIGFVQYIAKITKITTILIGPVRSRE